MKKSVVLLSVLLIVAVTLASVFAVEWQHERKRADALALRAFEQEPVETGAVPKWRAPQVTPQPELASETASERPIEMPLEAEPQRPKRESVMDYPGTLRTREHVNRLQTRLSRGTPLQDYQIRALIEALDTLYLEQSSAQQADEVDANDARLNDQIIQVASDILFESQLEIYMEMLKEGDRR